MTKLMNMLVSLLVGAMLIGVPAPEVHASGASTGELANVLRFRDRDGWSAPSIKKSRDDRTITLRFRRAPKNPLVSLNRELTERKRTVFAHAEVTRRGKGAEVRLTLTRRAAKVTRKKYMRKNSLIMVSLRSNYAIPSPSYTSMLPLQFEKLVLEEVESTLQTSNPGCEVLEAMLEEKVQGGPWIELKLVDCLQWKRQYKAARERAIRLIRRSTTPAPVALLTALRLNEWPRQRPLPVNARVNPETANQLPRGIAQEIALRQTRYALRKNNHASAITWMKTVQGEVEATLLNAAHNLRARVLPHAVSAGNTEDLIAIIDGFAMPPTDHPASAQTRRITAFALMNAGRTDEAAEIALPLLEREAAVVDNRLAKTLLAALAKTGSFANITRIAPLLPTNQAFQTLVGSSETLSPTTSSILATWLLRTWENEGIQKALELCDKSEGLQDPSGVLAHARATVLLGSGQCERIAAVGGARTEASLCFLARGEAENAAAVIADAQDDEDPIVKALRNHAVATAAFFDKVPAAETRNAGRDQ